jgi:serine protease Do
MKLRWQAGARKSAGGLGPWLVFAFAILSLGTVAQADAADGSETPLPSAFAKVVPENKDDLAAIQRHVQGLLKKAMPATVGLIVGGAQGSGVIVTKDGVVLTAGHVSAMPDRDCKIILPDGRTLKGKTLGANHGIDSGMIQITDKGEFPFCEMANSAELKAGQWCMAIGHPGGWQKGRNPVVRLGRIQDIGKTFIKTDCTLVGGDSGGPLFDMHGKVIGIHSRIGELITANLHVPIDTYRDTWDRLALGEEWGKNPFGFRKASNAYMGLELDMDSKTCKILTVYPDSPAAKAGLRANDVFRMFDGKTITSQDDLLRRMATKRPGNEVDVEILRGEDTVVLRITLGKRPT